MYRGRIAGEVEAGTPAERIGVLMAGGESETPADTSGEAVPADSAGGSSQ
jgi:hypothetical protein